MKKNLLSLLASMLVYIADAQVTLFNAPDFKGKSVTLYEGNYKMIPVEFKNKLMSLKIAGNYSAEIYSLQNFKGKRVTLLVNETSIPENWGGLTGSLKIFKHSAKFSDRVTTNPWSEIDNPDTISADVVIPVNWADSGKVYFFSECHYLGKKKELKPGNFPLTTTWSISSVKIPADKKIIVYTKPNYKGASRILSSDDNCIIPGWNNNIHSLRIAKKSDIADDDSVWNIIGVGGTGIKGSGAGSGYGSGGSGRNNEASGSGGGDWGSGQRNVIIPKIVIFDNCNFSGPSRALGNGTYPVMPTGFAAKVSAIRVPKGITVHVYTGKNFTGTLRSYNSDMNCLPSGINNKIQSMKVVGSTQ